MAQTASTLRRILAAAALAATALTAAAGQAATLKVTISKAEVVTLDGTATVVLIANPDVADVVLEQGHILFVLGKRPGETRLFAYDNNGNRLLERDVVVVPENERAVTVTRAVQPTDYSCDPRCVATGGAGQNGQGKSGPSGPAAPPQADSQAAAAAPAAGVNGLAGQ